MNATLRNYGVIVAVAWATVTAGMSSARADVMLERSVSAHASNRYTYDASSGERFVVRLRGDGDTDLDLIIRDQYDNEVCRSDGPSDRERCVIRDRNGGGRYKIEVRNLGDVYNDFHLTVI